MGPRNAGWRTPRCTRGSAGITQRTVGGSARRHSPPPQVRCTSTRSPGVKHPPAVGPVGAVRTWVGVVRTWVGVVRTWVGVVRTWVGVVRTWVGVVRTWAPTAPRTDRAQPPPHNNPVARATAEPRTNHAGDLLRPSACAPGARLPRPNVKAERSRCQTRFDAVRCTCGSAGCDSFGTHRDRRWRQRSDQSDVDGSWSRTPLRMWAPAMVGLMRCR